MIGNRIHRYLLREITLPGIGALVIFTFVMLTGRMLRLLEMVINKGVPIHDILKLFISLLPSFLIITLPLSFILGILLGFSRLSADNEITAMRAAGFGFTTLIKPVLATAIIASLLTGWLTTTLEPRGYRAFRDQLFQIASQRATIGLQSGTFNQDFPGLTLFPGKVHQKTDHLERVFISDQRVAGESVMIFADRGKILSDPEQRRISLQLEQGVIHRYQPNPQREDYQTVNFDRYRLAIDLDAELGDSTREGNIYELSMSELLSGAKTETDPRNRRKHLATFHQRLTLAVAPLILALLAPPLGIRSHRSGRSGGFAAGLLLFLIYYLVNSLAETLVVEQGLPAGLTIWLPSFIFMVLGFLSLRRTAHELPPGRPVLELLRLLWQSRKQRGDS